MSSTDGVTSSAQSERVIGRVKWFNNKAGYGFITVTDGSRSGSDVFIHHSAINVESQQYKYLVQGEYVNFDVVHTNSGTHEWQASNVSGVNSGKLMCETRREYKMARTTFRSEGEQEAPRQMRSPRELSPRGQPAPRARGEGPREGAKREWSFVGGQAENKGASRPQRRTAEAK
jgi:CspA family cold shock protein